MLTSVCVCMVACIHVCKYNECMRVFIMYISMIVSVCVYVGWEDGYIDG